MGENGVLKGLSSRFTVRPEVAERARENELVEQERLAAQRREHARYLADHAAAGVQAEADDFDVHVEGFSGKLAQAPELSTAPKPPVNKDALWVEKVKAGAKGTFLIYSPTFYGVHTHYRGPGRGTVLCFKDRSLCVGGHDEGSLRWHGFLHAFHFEENRQVFCHFTPEGAKTLINQLEKDTSFRGLKLEVRRSNAKKGPFYVRILGESEVDIKKLPRHRDARASIFKLFKIQPTGRMQSAAFSGGEEIDTGQG